MRLLLLSLAIALGIVIGPSCCSVQGTERQPAVLVEAYSPGFDPLRFYGAIRTLATECPLNAGFQVQLMEIDAAVWGMTWWDEDQWLYRIQIDARQPMHAVIDTLIHEWAHAMVWDASVDERYDAHGPIWGVAYARAYRAVVYGSGGAGTVPVPLDETVDEPAGDEKARWEPVSCGCH